MEKKLQEYLELATKLLDLDCELNLLDNQSFSRLSEIKQAIIAKELYFFSAFFCIEREFSPYSKVYFFVTNSPGSLPGFLAAIIGFEVCIEIAEPKIKPLASIEIIASASSNILLCAISNISCRKIEGC